MTSTNRPLLDRIPTSIWQALSLTVALLFFNLILLNYFPGLVRPLGMALRTGFGIVIPLTAILLYMILRIPGRLGSLLRLTAVMSIFALGLAGLWANGGTQSILLSGLIPLSDATNYYTDALRILHGSEISDFSAMRPFFPGFLSLLLWLSGRNLLISVSILTAIAGTATYLAGREVQRTHGPETAVFFLMSIFLYFRHHSGTTMSESLGVSVGLLGSALIWKSLVSKNEKTFLLGLVILTLALNIRPGAMFILPALLLWGSFFFRGDKKFSATFLGMGVLLIFGVFFLNSLMIKALAGPDATAFSNFSWALYGLVSGGQSWTYIFEVHPEVFSLDPSQQGSAIIGLILEQFLKNPLLALQGAMKYWSVFFSSTWYNAYSFVAGGNYWVNEAARYGMYLLSGFGLVKWLRNRNDPFVSLATFGALGVLISVPFVPPTDAYRVRLYAATIPFFVLLPSLGVSSLAEMLPSRLLHAKESSQHSLPEIFSVALAVCMMVAPIMLQSTGKKPVIEETACPVDMTRVVVRFDRGTYINIQRENIPFLDWMPNYHMSVFRNNAHDLADIRLTEKLTAVNPPATLFYALDFLSSREALVMIDTDQLPLPDSLLHLCGRWDNAPEVLNYNLFNAEFTLPAP